MRARQRLYRFRRAAFCARMRARAGRFFACISRALIAATASCPLLPLATRSARARVLQIRLPSSLLRCDALKRQSRRAWRAWLPFWAFTMPFLPSLKHYYAHCFFLPSCRWSYTHTLLLRAYICIVRTIACVAKQLCRQARRASAFLQKRKG